MSETCCAAGVARVDSARSRFREFVRTPLDILVIGGGISGAGVLLAAAQAGWRAALIEQKDFAFGSSSRSSKLVHGGLRYLKYGRVGLSYQSLRARDALMRDYPDSVHPLHFYTAQHGVQALPLRAALLAYDALAGCASRQQHDAADMQKRFPLLRGFAAQGGLSFIDGQSDDAALVMRVLQQAHALGAPSQNYLRAGQLLSSQGRVHGALVSDECSGESYDIRAQVVINATGAWAAQLQAPEQKKPLKLRPLRGSHLVLPFHKLPLTGAVFAPHPVDKRPVYALPWQGAVLFGTTDVDHRENLDQEPRISAGEYDYLLSGLRAILPAMNIDSRDVLSTFAGIRPTLDDGRSDPSHTDREHFIQQHPGYLTVAGGKLTTFRSMAVEVLRLAQKQLHTSRKSGAKIIRTSASKPVALPQCLGASQVDEGALLAATEQQIVHLDDLMLRRTRLGLVLPDGGIDTLPQLRTQVQHALRWDDERWQQEVERYAALHARHYSGPV